MANNFYPQGGYSQNGQRADKKKESPINKCEFTGYTKPRGNYPEIKVTELPNGGATVKFTLECKEFTGKSDDNGNPKYHTAYIPVSVWANKIITVAMLRSIVPGMKLHVVGRWSNQQYKDKNGQVQRYTECEAYVLDIQETPQMAAAPQMGYGQPYGYGQQMPPQGYAPQQQVPPQYPQQYGGAPQQPYYPQQPYPQPAPQQQYPGYAPQGGYAPQQPAPAPQPQAHRPAQAAPQQQPPAYYQAPQRQQAAPAPQPQSGLAHGDDGDLPVGDINI